MCEKACQSVLLMLHSTPDCSIPTNDPSTLISELNVSEGKKLMEEGYIGGGMLPKIQNCIDAIENGVSRVHILDGIIPHCLLLEIFTNKGIGTAIKNDVEERYYHGE